MTSKAHMKLTYKLLFAASFAAISIGFAQEDDAAFADALILDDDNIATLDITTVVATKTPKNINDVLPSVDTISEQHMSSHQFRQVDDVLSYLPGVSVVQAGQTGGVTSLFVRGQESNHVVVTLNGRRLAPGLAGLYNLELIDTTFLDSVQLQRGPVSSLYGSDALAGVLDLRMKDARKLQGTSLNAYTESGSFDTNRSGAQITAKEGAVGVVFDINKTETSNDRLQNDFENVNIRSNVALEIGDRTWIDLLATYQDSELQVPGSSLSMFFPESQINENESYLFSPRFTVERDEWDLSAYYSHTANELVATQSVFLQDNILDQTSNEVEAQLNLHPTDDTTFTIGGGWYEHEFVRTPLTPGPFNTPSEKKFSYGSVFAQADIDLPANFNLLASVRHDEHDSFESKTTYSTQLIKTVEATNTQFFGKYATGYKAPSGQDFVFLDPSVDPDLISPEESASWEVGIRQFLPDNTGSIAVTYFNAGITNLVDSIGFPAFPAIVDTETQGIELEGVLTPIDGVKLYANYTWLDAIVSDGLYFGGFAGQPGDSLPRRPEHTFAAGITLSPIQKWDIGAEIRGADTRLDNPGVYLNDYSVLRIFTTLRLTENTELFGRVENVLDEEYENTIGYAAPSTAAFIGARIRF
ncbi:MAG: TonB-dependent receptor plug domain-containing protein [Verrucomicrobiales bacterium]